MKYYCIVMGWLFAAPLLFGQMEADQWMLGYNASGWDESRFSVMSFDFRQEPPLFHLYKDYRMFFHETAAMVCNKEGDLLLWTNGMLIFTQNNDIVDTISRINDYQYWDLNTRFYIYYGLQAQGFNCHNCALILPFPEHKDRYIIIHHYADYNPERNYFSVNQWLTTEIQMGAENSEDSNESILIDVLYKDQLIGDKLDWKRRYNRNILSVRHGNGRDWWLLMFRGSRPEDEGSYLYDVFLLEPGGLRHYITNTSERRVADGMGQAVFSPLGNYAARLDAVWVNKPQVVTLYRFDRCSGTLAIIDSMHMTPASAFVGVAFSPSERFLYANTHYELWQYDLWAEDISGSATLIDVWDGYIQPGWFDVAFGPMTLGPDSRIYMAGVQGSSRIYSVIHRPDEAGKSCDFRQHDIWMPATNARTAPNFANFRLGPLDGSPCDTLGLDNHPVARWRHEQDKPWNNATMRFVDLSYFRPEEWQWEFGDGHTSTDQHPNHTYADDGAYHVCLTVSNEYASDSTCQWIYLIHTSTEDSEIGAELLQIYPNPFTGFFGIQTADGRYHNADIRMFDMHGRTVLAYDDTPLPARIHVGDLPPGVYAVVLEQEGKIVKTEKLMKVE